MSVHLVRCGFVHFYLLNVPAFRQIFEYSRLFPLVLVAFPVARAMGGRKVVASPCAKDSGLAHIFAENSDKRVVSVVLLLETMVYLLISGVLLFGVTHGTTAALILTVLLMLWYAFHEKLSIQTFGGITGDLAGFCISISELLCLAVAAFGGLVL